MRGALSLAVALAGCGGGDFTPYEGVGRAELVATDRPNESRTWAEPDEQARARTLRDGRIEVQLDECSFTTEPSEGGRATIAPGTQCKADRSEALVEIEVQSGEVVLDAAASSLSVRLEGRGRTERLGEHLHVRYRYSFTGTVRR